MSPLHYRLSVALAASLSLALAACGASPPATPQASAAPPVSPAPQANAAPRAGGSPQNPANVKPVAADAPGDIDTESTIWTVLGLAKKQSVHQPGPHTGNTVSPILWQAALDTLDFTTFSSQDPLTGELVTDWYSPKEKPNERYKVNVFILSRMLRSDAVAVTVERQQQSAEGQWADSPIDRKVDDDLETAILRRAGQLKREWMKAYAAK